MDAAGVFLALVFFLIKGTFLKEAKGGILGKVANLSFETDIHLSQFSCEGFEFLFVNQASGITYEVIFHAGNRFFAGSNADIYVELVGKFGESEIKHVDSSLFDIQRGNYTSHKILFNTDVGPVKKIIIKHDNKGLGTDWYLEEVTLRKLPDGHPIVFPVHKWLSSRAGHSLTVEARRSHVEDCGVAASSRIVNGHNAAPNEWPWQVQIVIPFSGRIHHCGGTLIDQEFVITAAHCVDRMTDPESYVVRLGEYNLNKDDGTEQTYLVKRIIIHPKYISKTQDNDIAILQLDKPAMLTRAVKLACLPRATDILEHGQMCYLTGWGRLGRGKSIAYKLQQARLPIVDYENCKNGMSDINPVNGNMLCAGGRGKSGCHGDSGGPLVCPNEKTGRFVLQGVVSWGSPYCAIKETRFSIFVKVKKYVSWIESHIYSKYL